MSSHTIVAVGPERIVSVTGSDRLSYLDDVTTQQLRDRRARTVASCLELDAKGSPLSVFDVVILDEVVLLLAPDETVAEDLVQRLGSRTFLADAAFAHDDRRLVSLRGADGHRIAADAGAAVEPGQVEPRVGSVVVGRDDGVDVLVAPGDLDEVIGRFVDAGAQPGDADDLDRWRVAAGVPRWGHEIAPPHLPEELGLLPTHVHLAKGCYPGQEAVARMWMLGRPRRRLAQVAVEGDVEPGWAAGDGRQRAEVTGTVATDDGTLALAFVPADAEVGARFEGEDGAVEVRALVGSDRPVVGHDPNVSRRRDQRA